MLYYFIFVMMPIRAAKQRMNGIAAERSDGAMERGSERRSGIAESRSGRSENTGERGIGGSGERGERERGL